MFITNTTVFGGRGFSVGGGGVLKTASGYPLTLEKTLAKLPENIAVSGASGGVGDYDSVKQAYKIPLLILSSNLYDIIAYPLTPKKYVRGADGEVVTTSQAIACTEDPIPCKQWRGKTLILNKRPGKSSPGLAFYDANDDFLNGEANAGHEAGTPWVFVVPDNALYMRFSTVSNDRDITIVQTKTINLYSNRQLTASVIRLFVYPKTKEAKVLNQDISALQDWSQDWKIPKADSLTVSAGTTVEPSSMEIKYYGKR